MRFRLLVMKQSMSVSNLRDAGGVAYGFPVRRGRMLALIKVGLDCLRASDAAARYRSRLGSFFDESKSRAAVQQYFI